jgi:hypothetical protein
MMWETGRKSATAGRCPAKIKRGAFLAGQWGEVPMGRVVKQVSDNSTKYYWYPGDKKEWIRAAVAAGIGAVLFGILLWVTGSLLISVTVGTSLTVGLAGLNFGRRDFRATHGFPELSGKAARRAAMVHGGRAAWRGMVQGFGGAMAAVLIANLPARGFVANWLLPIVPVMAGALAHQAGMLYERLALAATPKDLPPIPAALPGGDKDGDGANESDGADAAAPAKAEFEPAA